jgi:hypothetical protein
MAEKKLPILRGEPSSPAGKLLARSGLEIPSLEHAFGSTVGFGGADRSAHAREGTKVAKNPGELTPLNARECGCLCRYSHSQFTGPVDRMDWANLIAGCSGYFDRLSLALK